MSLMTTAALPLLFNLLLTAMPPKVGLITGSQVAVTDADALAVRADVREALEGAGLRIEAPELACRGDLLCQQQKARLAELKALILMTLVRGPHDIIVDIEVTSPETGAQLAQHSWNWKKASRGARPAGIEALAGLIAKPILELEAVAVAAAATPTDKPTVTSLVPSTPRAAESLAVQPQREVASRAPVVATAIGAGVALIGCGIFTGVGVANHSQLPRLDSGRQSIPLEEATRLQQAANGAYTGAAVTGGLAAALATTSLILWLVNR